MPLRASDLPAGLAIGKRFDVAHALAAEIVCMNDEYWTARNETPEARWIRMRAWATSQIVREEPESAGS